MPTYEYKCESCGHSFEFLQSITDEPLAKCPKCDGRIKRLISTGAGVILKGSGFYQTDYKNSCSNNKPSGGDGSSSCPNCPLNK
ncbi:MAG: zinc ribbon domain-containing protein [Candidatus Omnitrophota bacterium]|jgi:putative FmdB family regulatory protein